MSETLIHQMRAALILARDCIQDEMSCLISSDTLTDEHGEARMDTMSTETAEVVAKMERDIEVLCAAIVAADAFHPEPSPTKKAALNACRILREAYRAAKEYGDHVDWSDVDEAHAAALEALGETVP